jgi:uncharacterized protein YhaN
MRIRSVTAHAFGPLVGETMRFADGMTVVVGDNESAKSTWHAAIYAALCGHRRGPGRRGPERQRFIDAHKPWDREDWLVSAEIVLDDGRRIEMRQDLAGRVDCHARDLDLAAAVADDVINDGMPDASRWLGLDRASFISTACIEQAQMLRVRAEADGLQHHLQRAAATAGADETAAAALQLIRAFEREHVGLDRANSTRPLRRALDGCEEATSRLEEARRQHQEYLGLAAKADDLRIAADHAENLVRAHEAAAAEWHASQLAKKARLAADLTEQIGNEPPASIAADDALLGQASRALAAWEMRPGPPDLSGPTSEQLGQRLAALAQSPQSTRQPTQGMRVLLIVAAGLAAAGVALLAVGQHAGGLALLATGIGLSIVAGLRRPGSRSDSGRGEQAHLQAQLESRERDEQRAEQDQRKRSDAERQVLEAAAACGRTETTADAAIGVLKSWQDDRREQVERYEADQARRAQLKALLGDRNLNQLQDDESATELRAADLAGLVDPQLLAAIDPRNASDQLQLLREDARNATSEADVAAGDLQRLAKNIPGVAETEESLAAAEEELRRVQELQDTLALTRQFLERAEEQVHRHMAPALAASVKQRLPELTAGRYTDVSVDPVTLKVEVCGPARRWRTAELLSYGTAEQIYLLLRIALTDHLTKGHDTCPLILDDVTVHADKTRTRDILELLLEIAEERQVILFTQEDEVAAWARDRLGAPGHAVQALEPLAFS